MNRVVKCGMIVISFFMILLFIVNLWLLLDKKINHKEFPTIFGWSYAVVRSNSMQPVFSKGAVLLLHEESEYQVNDIVTYKDPMDTLTTTHRLVEKTGTHYVTKGDANDAEDVPIDSSMIYAKVVLIIPYLGLLSLFLQNKLLLTSLIFLLCIYAIGKRKN